MDKIEIGDIVVLNSEGPKMTVSESISSDNRYNNVPLFYSDNIGVIREINIPAGCLQKPSEPPEPRKHTEEELRS